MRYLLLLLLALPLSACNLGPGSGSGGDDDDATGDDDDATGGPVDTTIADLSAGNIETETEVTVTGVVTTRWWNDEDDNQAGFWIQDGEGPGTGILVFTFYDVSVEAEKLELFSAGDEVEITGTYRFPFDFAELVVDNVSDIVRLGEGTMPAPHVVDAADISLGFAADDLIGVIVSIEDVNTDESPGWNNFFEWLADDVIVDAPLLDGDAWMYPDVWEGYALDSVTGVLHRDFGDAKIWTRWRDDVSFTYPGCEAVTGEDTLPGIRCNAAPGAEVNLSDLVVVSGEPRIANSFYAQSTAGGDFSGVQIFSFNDITVPNIGDTFTVSGDYTQYRGGAEIIVQATTDFPVAGTADVTPTVVADACTIGEAHEGMLVSIASVTVSAQDGDAENFGYHEVEGCPLIRVGSFFFADSDAFGDATPSTGGEIVNLVGVVTDSFNEYSINPRSDADWDSWAE